jgi:hypothetical protein
LALKLSNRAFTLLVWLAACAASLAIFGEAFYCWFLMDDFAWLGLKQELESGVSVWSVLFEPRAQGTVRVFSERLYFLALTSLFGFDPMPFRIVAFAVQFANLWLLIRIAGRLSGGSLLAGFAAAMFYACSARMVRPLAWASSFNQVLAACAILSAFLLLHRWVETRRPVFWWAQCAVFLLSFGVLESVMVYPAVVCVYTWVWARERFRQCLWLWVPSLAFAAWHLLGVARPAGSSHQYAPVFDAGMFGALANYAWIALGPTQPIVTGCIAAAAIAGIAWRLFRHRDGLPLFFAFWFVLFLAPVLPFQNRFAGYYVVVPLTGLALCVGLLAAALPLGRAVRWPLTIAILALYAGFSVRDAHEGLQWFSERSENARRMIEGGVQVCQTRKADTLLLSGVDTDLFTLALQDSPFRLFGLRRVYLVPGSETSIRARADLGGVSAYSLTLPKAVELLESGSAAVLSIVGSEVHDATARYKGVAMNQYLQSRPRQINLGAAGYDSLLGPGWWPVEENFRWMSKSASVRLGGGLTADSRLTVTGFCPDTVSSQGPVTLRVAIAGEVAAVKTLTTTGSFTLSARVPGKIAGEPWITVDLSVDRVTRLPGDKRDLGLIFGTVALKP